MTVMQLWRHLAENALLGQEHAIDSEVSHRRPNSLRRCPACPEVGFNVNKVDMRDALETDT